MNKLLLIKLTIIFQFVLIANIGFGQAIYYNLVPDVTIAQESNWRLDLNQDGTYDVELSQQHVSNTNYEYNGIFVNFSSSNSSAIGVNGFSPAYKLDGGVEINSSSTKTQSGTGGIGVIENGTPHPSYYWSNGVTEKYLGFAVELDGAIHYGWLLLSIPADMTTITVHSYAFNLISDSPITTGEMPVGVSVAGTPQFSDIGNNSDGSDFQISFTKASDESQIASYRLLIFPPSLVGTVYNIHKAVYYDYYTEVIPDGSDHTLALTSDAKDVEGNLLTIGKTYYALVLSVPNTDQVTYALSDHLSCYTSTPIAASQGVTVSDLGDNSNASDLGVTILAPAVESTVEYYFLYIVPSAQSASFDLDAALAVPNGKYSLVYKTGDDVTYQFSTNAKDINGDLITNNIAYKVYAVSFCNIAGYTPAISPASSEITLSVTSGIKSIVADADIYNYGQDLYIKNLPSSGKVSIYNMNGNLVYQNSLNAGNNILEVSELQPGVFTVEVSVGENRQYKKFFIR